MSDAAAESKMSKFLNGLGNLLKYVSMGKYYTKLYHRVN
jgi:hypothetical protein